MPRLRLPSFPAVIAGLLTVLVSYASSVVIVLQAARSLGFTGEQISSWMWALGIGLGVTCIGLSFRYRLPVVTAWSTPGAALLATHQGELSTNEAIGAFLLCALLTTALGFSGLLEKVLRRIPLSLAAGMLAGVLLRFGMDVFTALDTALALPATMLGSWLLARRLFPRHAVLICLVTGIAVAGSMGALSLHGVPLAPSRPVALMPQLSVSAVLGITLPLLLVTMASQNLPGIAAMQAAGYQPPVSRIIGWIGVVNMVLAPFGAFALNLAAITAAICMSADVDPDRSRRWPAAVVAGGLYLMAGLFGATVVALIAAFPAPLVTCLAGIALFGTLASALATAMEDPCRREPALICFLVTASGLSLGNIGSAFWGLLAGLLALALLRTR